MTVIWNPVFPSTRILFLRWCVCVCVCTFCVWIIKIINLFNFLELSPKINSMAATVLCQHSRNFIRIIINALKACNFWINCLHKWTWRLFVRIWMEFYWNVTYQHIIELPMSTDSLFSVKEIVLLKFKVGIKRNGWSFFLPDKPFITKTNFCDKLYKN